MYYEEDRVPYDAPDEDMYETAASSLDTNE